MSEITGILVALGGSTPGDVSISYTLAVPDDTVQINLSNAGSVIDSGFGGLDGTVIFSVDDFALTSDYTVTPIENGVSGTAWTFHYNAVSHTISNVQPIGGFSMAVAVDTTAPTTILLSNTGTDVIGATKTTRISLAGATSDAALTTIATDLDALSNAKLAIKVAKDTFATGLKNAAVNAPEPNVKTLLGLTFVATAPERRSGLVEITVLIPAPVTSSYLKPGGGVDTTNTSITAITAALASALVYERFNNDGTQSYVGGFVFDASRSGLVNENGVRII